MSDPNYPDDIRQYDSDPRSPFYNDPTDSPEFEDKKHAICKSRIRDINGYFIESFSESPDALLKSLAELVVGWLEAPSGQDKDIEVKIGQMVVSQVCGYCTPDDDEVLESLAGDGGE